MDDDVRCDRCRARRALVHCAEDAARLCLPCDVAAHAGAAGHERAPLCDGCHATPAAARCDGQGRAALCGACARAAACGHALRPAVAYTGFPEAAELARILAVDDYMITELPSQTLVQDAQAALLADDGDEHLASQGLDVFAAHDTTVNIANSVDSIECAVEGSSSSLDYDNHPLIMPSWSELMTPSDDAHLFQPLAEDSTTYDQFSMGTSTNDGVKVQLPSGTSPPAGSSRGGGVMGYHGQELPEKPCENVELRMDRQGKRQRAMQRYNDKKRRFGRQIMYSSSKATADTRKRVRGRFAKAAAASTSGVAKAAASRVQYPWHH